MYADEQTSPISHISFFARHTRGGMIHIKGHFMKKFLAMHMGPASALAKWTIMDEEKRKRQEGAGKQAWTPHQRDAQ